MDIEHLNTLVALVRQARVRDRETFVAQQEANAAWKQANAELTERQKVLNDYVAQQISEAIALGTPA